MLSHYDTLRILSRIAAGSPAPTRYHATPREMILESSADWETINKDLHALQQESLVNISHADTLRVCITDKGLEKLRAIEGKAALGAGKFQRIY